MPKKKTDIESIAGAAAGYALGEATARGVMQVQALGDKRELIAPAIPAVLGFILLKTGKGLTADIGAGMLGTGIVRAVQLGMDKLTGEQPAQGFSRVNYKGSVQDVVNGVISKYGTDDMPVYTQVIEGEDGDEFVTATNAIDTTSFYSPN